MGSYKDIVAYFVPILLLCKMVNAHPIHEQIRLPNTKINFLNQTSLLGPISPQKDLHISIWLKLRNQNELEHQIEDIYTPGNQQYQKFMSNDVFIAKYAPKQETFKQIEQYFAKYGLKLIRKGGVYLEISGQTAQIEKALDIRLNRYEYEGKRFYANNQSPSIPADLSPYIEEITGLDNVPPAKPQLIVNKPAPHTTTPLKPNFTSDSYLPTYVPTTTSLAGFNGANLRKAYGLSTLAPIQGQSIDGTGQTIVLVDGCSADTPNRVMNDANRFIAATPSLQPRLVYQDNFVVVDVRGHIIPLNSPMCPTEDGWSAEISLDVQSSHTIAPGAKIVLVISNSLDEARVIDTILQTPSHTIGGFSQANVISNSWSFSESFHARPSIESSLMVAFAQGLSVNFATGDCGDDTNPQNSCGNPPYPSASSTPAVNYPASSSWSTAVGGSSLFVDTRWRYAFETGWGTTEAIPAPTARFVAGGGGGISRIYKIPSWQKKTIAGFQAGGYTTPIKRFRALPDVALLADSLTGLNIYNTSECAGFCKVGGTSLACPLFSGTITLVNQVRGLIGGSLLGAAAPYLYTMHSKLLSSDSLHVVIPPHQIINSALLPFNLGINNAPPSAFALLLGGSAYLIYGWDSSLTVEPESQFWNDAVGVGTPNIPNFVLQMARF